MKYSIGFRNSALKKVHWTWRLKGLNRQNLVGENRQVYIGEFRHFIIGDDTSQMPIVKL